MSAALSAHTELGPGLLESLYEQALAQEFTEQGLRFEQQKPLPVNYKGTWLKGEFKLDFLVENLVVVELKSVKKIEPVHEAQLLTYLKLSNIWAGLILNFNVPKMRDGIKRIVYGEI